MSDPKLISPLLDGYVMGAPISSHHGIRCCPAMKQTSDDKFIVKVISIPSSQSQLDALLLTGAYKDPADAMDYFKEMADSIALEADHLRQLAKLDGFLCYDGCQVVPMEDNQLGYQVYMVSSYKRSLEKYMRKNPLSLDPVLTLGLDLCTALSSCRRAGYMYVDLKPSNIFLSEDMEYRIGDLGLVPLDSLRFTSLPAKYRSPYSPPELQDPMNALNETADTYAVGAILYQALNNGRLPVREEGEPLPLPANAPQNLGAVILKALAEDPSARWDDPVQLGQAIAACRLDMSVISHPSEEDSTQVFSTSDVLAASQKLDSLQSSDETRVIPPVSSMIVSDDTKVVPVIPSAVSAAPVSGDTRVVPTVQIGGQPHVISSLSAEKSAISEIEKVPVAVGGETKVIPVQSLVSSHSSSDISAAHTTPSVHNQEELWDDEYDEEDDELYEEEDMPETSRLVGAPKRPRKPLGKGWILPLVVIVLLGLLGFGGFYYYQNYYLQTINSMIIEGMHSELVVTVDTQVDEGLLWVSCTDTYGNTKEQPLVGGKAEFTDLLPNSQYKVTLHINGFHQLVGKTSDVFNTESRTEIASISGIAGAVDGSVKISITVDGPEPEEWVLSYTAEGEEEKSLRFSGHEVTVTGLVVPKTYTFTVTPVSKMYMTGNNTFQYTATALVLAQNLTFTSYDGDTLTVQWDVPDNHSVSSWQVRCYGDDGYDQTITTTETHAEFSGVTASRAYHVEVTASGMTQFNRQSISPNPITISSFQVSEQDASSLTISWEYSGQTPEDGWLLMYSLDGSNTQSVVKCEGTTAVISPKIFGAEYRFTIQSGDTYIFNSAHTYTCQQAELYSDHSFNAKNVTTYLLPTPDLDNWTSSNVSQSDYTDQFTSGQNISIILYCSSPFFIPSDEISVLYVIRNADGNVVTRHIAQESIDWHDLWVNGHSQYGELDLPSAPMELGSYSLTIYFNGQYVASADFSIAE